MEYRISGRKGYVHDGLPVAKRSDSYQELLINDLLLESV